VLVALLLLALPAFPAQDNGDGLADDIFDELNRLRLRENVGEVVRNEILDEVASRRAAVIAAEPPARRLPPPKPLSDVLERRPDLWFGRAVEQIDLLTDVQDPVQRSSRSWRDNSPSFALLTDPVFDAVGIGAAESGDGTLVIVSIFVVMHALEVDIGVLELQTIQAINGIRREYELKPLQPQQDLSDVARDHSADMADRDYFDHDSPEGDGPGDRMRRHAVPFRFVAENIAKSLDMDDPVNAVVEGWMKSPGHRKNIMRGDVYRTGVGVAIDELGRIYFTQLFVRTQVDPQE